MRFNRPDFFHTLNAPDQIKKIGTFVNPSKIVFVREKKFTQLHLVA